MPLTLPDLRRLIGDCKPDSIWVAYSGGVDSHVLLHCLSKLANDLKPTQLKAAHVHHGIQEQADDWAEHCANVCAALNIPFQNLSVNAQAAKGESPEAAARAARYSALEKLLKPGDILATAQHTDDQAETLLLQLLRGSGPRGLAAMAASKAFGSGRLIRPLLDVSRQEILDYAQKHNLSWVEDPSNTNTRFDRNYLRSRVMPMLAERWPSVSASLSRSAASCAETLAVMREVAEQDITNAAGGGIRRLDIGALLNLSPARLNNALRHWFESLNLPAPHAVHLQRVTSELLNAPEDRFPLVEWAGAEVRRFGGEIYAGVPLPEHDVKAVYPIQTGECIEIGGAGTVRLVPGSSPALISSTLKEAKLEIRFRQGGERFHPTGRAHSQSLKKLFQEVGIAPWLRERTPLLYVNGRLAAVAGVGIGKEYLSENADESLVLQWKLRA